tara:strand:- start:105 stop:530 length:426 start_codon:yes stop_codon:yes gene_type:complete
MDNISNLENEFNGALSRYQSGEEIVPLVEDFKKIIDQIPNHFAAWTCLAWLYLLLKQNDDALYAAKKAVKLNGQDVQARMNLSLALLATNTKGVRDNIDLIKRIIMMAPDMEEDLKLSVEDGFSRYPEWPELSKVKNWLDL